MHLICLTHLILITIIRQVWHETNFLDGETAAQESLGVHTVSYICQVAELQPGTTVEPLNYYNLPASMTASYVTHFVSHRSATSEYYF